MLHGKSADQTPADTTQNCAGSVPEEASIRRICTFLACLCQLLFFASFSFLNDSVNSAHECAGAVDTGSLRSGSNLNAFSRCSLASKIFPWRNRTSPKLA